MNFFIVLAYLCLIGLIIRKRKEYAEKQTEIFSKDSSLALKGVAAVMVFFAHTQNFLSENGYTNILLYPIKAFGGMGVLLFFFLSGYGIAKGYVNKKPSWLFWKNRLLNTFIPACIISALFTGIKIIFTKESIGSFMVILLGGQWYVDVVMLCYLCFFISWMLAKKRKNSFLILCSILCLAVAVVFYILKFNARWYNGIMLFPFGVFIALNENKILCFSKRIHFVCGILSLIFFAVTGVLFTHFRGNLIADIFKTLSGFSLAFFFVEFEAFYGIGNKITIVLGKRSLYIYLCHLWTFNIISSIYLQEIWKQSHLVLLIFFVLIVTIIFTEACYRGFSHLSSKLDKYIIRDYSR